MNTQLAPHILIVDDNEDDFLLIQRQIHSKWPGAEALHAFDQKTLIDQLTAFDVDVVVCDYSMPELTHKAVDEILRARGLSTPLILLSGMATEAVGADLMNHGVRDYIEKAKPERLIPAIEREIQTRQLEKEKAELERAHLRAIFFDSATGFLNRQGLQKSLEDFSAAKYPKTDLCLLTVGLSRKSRKTASLSHSQQKALLAHLHSRLKRLFMRDLVCQWSDNLIAILIKGFDWQGPPTDEMLERLTRIETELQSPVVMESFAVQPQLKMGLARPYIDGARAEDLVQHSRSVAATLQSQNGSLITAVDKAVHEDATRRAMIFAGLGKGIENDQLQLRFQPVQCLKTGKVISAEALVRWEHEDLGLVMPDEFIEVAEDSGLISALGGWVVQHACVALQTLRAKGYNLTCAINCSTVQLLNQAFISEMKTVLDLTGVPPECIEFEITETAAIDDMAQTLSVVQELKKWGPKVALDDFGTGYSSLSYLRQLPLNVLKIDKSFIRGLLNDTHSHMIVKAVIDLAHALGLVVHAEGIETVEQRELLKKMSCDRLQGYLLAKPMPLDQFEKWLSERSD